MSSYSWCYCNHVSIVSFPDTCTLLYAILPQILFVFPQKRNYKGNRGLKHYFFKSSLILEKKIDCHHLISQLYKNLHFEE